VILKSMRNGPSVTRTMPWDCDESSRELLLNREWLVTNGLGGYASGSVSGAITRKYHTASSSQAWPRRSDGW